MPLNVHKVLVSSLKKAFLILSVTPLSSIVTTDVNISYLLISLSNSDFYVNFWYIRNFLFHWLIPIASFDENYVSVTVESSCIWIALSRDLIPMESRGEVFPVECPRHFWVILQWVFKLFLYRNEWIINAHKQKQVFEWI